MKFAIASVEFWQNVGFQTQLWRKNKDGTKALVHLEYARALVNNIEENENIIIYDCPSAEFEALVNSEEWSA